MSQQTIVKQLFLYGAVAVLLSACAQSDAPPLDVEGVAGAVEIIKSPNDNREYRYLKLDNELTAILVHRPEEGKAGAALAVARGSDHDLPEHEGIAHFLEHMLFLGTEKYPDPDGYSDFITKHGGGNNAYTANELTNYFFDIDEQQFPEALDRFAQFFVAPLLDADYVDREKNAVHSEYQMQMRSDGWRGFSVLKTVMNPAHPGSRFNIGSLETLAGADRALVEQYYQDHYSADQMTLVVVSQRSLDEQEALVTERFAAVPNRSLGEAPVPPQMYLDETLPFAFGYQTVMSNRSLSIEWPVPDIKPHYRIHPLSYLGNILGHEGEGSLHAHLTDRGWINYLSAGGSSVDSGNSSFNVSIGLTEAGWQNMDEVNGLVFAYIDSMREKGAVEEWRFDEIAAIADLNFRFMEHGSTLSSVNRLVNASTLYEPQDLLRGPYLYEAFDPDLIENYLGYLTRENAITSISAPDLETDLTEKWFSVPYTLTPAIDVNREVDHAFDMPAPNIFVPEDTSVIKGLHNAAPALVRDTKGLRVWHAVDTEFGVPRAFVNVRLQYEEAHQSPRDSVMNALLARLLNIEFNPHSYPALIAGLNGSFAAYAQGLSVAVNGYDDKQKELLGEMLSLLGSYEIDAEQLETQKIELAKQYGNFKDERGFQQAYSTVSHLLISTAWAPSILADNVDGITADGLSEWMRERLDNVTATALIVGNVSDADAAAIGDTLAANLNLVAAERRFPTIHIPDGLHTHNLAIEHDDAVYLIVYGGENDSIEERAMLQLISQVVAQAYFNELRTEQQLGYATMANSNELFKHPGMVFLVQSPVADTAHLQTATSAFVAARRLELDAMTDEEFDGYKQGLLTSLLERDKNLAERSRRYMSDLVEANADFNTREQLAAAIEAISLDALRAGYDRVLDAASPRRLEVFSPGKSGVALTEGIAILDAAMFK